MVVKVDEAGRNHLVTDVDNLVLVSCIYRADGYDPVTAKRNVSNYSRLPAAIDDGASLE